MRLQPLPALLLAATLVLPTLAHADDPATALLARVAAKASATQSLRATLNLSRVTKGSPAKTATASILLLHPNFASLRFTTNDEAVPAQLASDGTTLFVFPTAATYTRTPIDAHATQLNEPWWLLPVRYFFTQSFAVFANVPDPTLTTHLLPDETVHNQLFHVIAVKGTQPFAYVEKLYITPDDLLQRTTVDFGPTTFSAELISVHLDLPLLQSSFRFTPPTTAKLQSDDPTATMLALGAAAPPFHLPSLNGTAESFATQPPGTQATLVNFWYLNCPPCRIENPDFEKLYQQFHSRGFNLVSIDRGDTAPAVAAYTRKAGLTFPILLGGDMNAHSIFTEYKISTFPETYLLDAHNRVVYRAAGADLPALRQALAKLGFQ